MNYAVTRHATNYDPGWMGGTEVTNLDHVPDDVWEWLVVPTVTNLIPNILYNNILSSEALPDRR